MGKPGATSAWQRSLNYPLDNEDGKYIKLVVQLPEGLRIESTFQASARDEITELLSRFVSLTGHS